MATFRFVKLGMILRSSLVAALVGLGGPATDGAELELGGLTFSDELGGVRLIDGWGTGSLDDPLTLVEEITGHGPAVIVVRGMHAQFGNRIESQHSVGFALNKIVRNATGQPWTLFNLELREFLEQESPFRDGLSFGQASDVGRPFNSDIFATNIETREPYDGVQFYDGVVAPDATVAFNIVVTDTTPRWKFYLMQRRDSPLAELKMPASGKSTIGTQHP